MPKNHPLLKRQLAALGLAADRMPDGPAAWEAFLEKVGKSYINMDQDRYLMERSISISSREMEERWNVLKGLEGQWRSMAECAPDMVLTVDQECRVLFSNRPFPHRGQDAGRLVAADREMFRSLIREVILMGASKEMEAEGMDGGEGRKWYSIRMGPITTEGGAASAILMVRDVTGAKRLQEEVDLERSIAMQSAKMATLGEMAGGVAHEINNPLCIINGLAMQIRALAEEGGWEGRDLGKVGEKIMATVVRMNKIVNALRACARDGTTDPFLPTPAGEIVADVLELCREKFKHLNIELRPPPPGKGPVIECQSVQISQVLLNLLNNAVDAVADAPEKWVQLSIVDAGERVRFEVTDSGRPIPPHVRERIMRPFFTTKPLGKGTGLGLSISLSIAKAHEGTLGLDEDRGHTRFTLALPKVRGRTAVA